MQALGPLNPLEMMFVLLFGGGFGLSPGPEDPQMARIAPPECLYYTSWAAAVQPDPKSPNATDQLLAEPEVKAFLALMEKRQVATMQAFVPSLGRAGVDARGQQILADLGRLLALLRGKPGALYISHLRLHGHGPPEVTGAAMLRLGEQAESVGQLLKKFQSRFPTEQVRQVEIGGHTWTRIQFDPGFPSIDWTLADGALMVGLGDGAAAELMARREANPPAWLSEMRAKLKVPRVASVTFLDLGAVLRLAGEASGSPQFEGILQVLGLDRVQTLSVLRGRDETGCVTRALLTVQGKGHGLLEWLDAGPLTADSLALVPRESVVALAGRLNLAGLFDTWLELMRKVDPREAEQVQFGREQMQRQLGFDPRDDLLASVGDSWRIFAGPGPAELITGWTVALEIRQPEKFQGIHDDLLALVRPALQQEGGPALDTRTAGGQTVYTLQMGQPGIPVAPSWCLTGQDLLVSLTAQPLVSLLTSRQDGSLSRTSSIATQPQVAPLLTGHLLAMAYVDTQHVVRTLLPWVRLGLQAAARQPGGAFFPLSWDLSRLPAAETVLAHLQPARLALRRTADGLELEVHQSLPGVNPNAVAPVAVALLLPAVQSAREAVRCRASMNQMKQIGLALLNFADVHGSFPAGYSADDKGKPLLSWRVHILPYLEEQALYDQFHLDEPWDSPHNRRLIGRMPGVFRSPNSTGPPGRTNYLGVGGTDGTFVRPQPGSQLGTKLQEINDGTSMTIMTVEVPDSAAVIWSKPGDFAADKKVPTKGLLGLRPGGFLAGFADGSVRFISQATDAAILHGIFTKAGGEVIDFNEVIHAGRIRPAAVAAPAPAAAQR